MSHGPWHYRIAARIAALVNRIGDAWNWLVGPIERLFGRLGETMLGALDSFEGLETVVVGLVRTIFWPLIALGRLIGRLLPSGAGPFGPLVRALGYLFGWVPKLGVWRLWSSASRGERTSKDTCILYTKPEPLSMHILCLSSTVLAAAALCQGTARTRPGASQPFRLARVDALGHHMDRLQRRPEVLQGGPCKPPTHTHTRTGPPRAPGSP